jgi:hypothetical protein
MKLQFFKNFSLRMHAAFAINKKLSNIKNRETILFLFIIKFFIFFNNKITKMKYIKKSNFNSIN